LLHRRLDEPGAVRLSAACGECLKIGSGWVHLRMCQTTGADVVTLEVEGEIDAIEVAGGISAAGRGSDAVHLRSGPMRGLDGVEISAAAGERIAVSP
jgi:hypothetical protein